MPNPIRFGERLDEVPFAPGQDHVRLAGALDAASALQERNDLLEVFQTYPDRCFDYTFNRHLSLEQYHLAVTVTITALATAEVVLWRPGLFEAARKGAKEAFTGTTAPDLATWPHQLWLLSDAWPADDELIEELRLPAHCGLMGMLLFPTSEGPPHPDPDAPVGVAMLFFGVYAHPDPSRAAREGRLSELLPRARTCTVVRPGQTIGSDAAALVGAMRFLHTELVHLAPALPPRGDRRRYEKKHGKPPPPIRVVTLRKYAKADPAEGHEPGGRDFSCHFLVSGHWRKNHWHPDEPIYVNPYVKGDTDKPFKPPRETIYRVSR